MFMQKANVFQKEKRKKENEFKIYEVLNLKNKPEKDQFIVAQLYPEFYLKSLLYR